MIYALQILDFRYVKFGFTKTVEVSERISALQTGCPFEIKPVFITEGTLRQEQELHKSLNSAFGRCGVPIPPNEWYPGRMTLTKHVLSMIMQEHGGINHAIAKIDEWHPNVNQGGRERQGVGYEAKRYWPEMSDSNWKKYYGDFNNQKKPKNKDMYKLRVIKRSGEREALKLKKSA